MSGALWYARPVAAACAALAAIAASVYVLAGAEYGPRESSAHAAYAVTIRHYGVDAREMERSVAVPLEDAMASIAGALEVSSDSEYGKARVLVRFSPGVDGESVYESVRDAAQRIYGSLPSSAQRPEISSTSEGRGPVWVAAVYSDRYTETTLGRMLERVVKPAFEKLPGAGDVELAGTGLPEVLVEVDDIASSALGVTTGMVARALACSDLLAPAGALGASGVESTIVADGRFLRYEDIATALVPNASGKPVPLGAFASITRRDRVPDALSRVDSLPAITVAVRPGGGANLPALSKAIARETAALSAEHGITFRVLSDSGADVAKSFRSTLNAAGQGVLAVALASALLVGARRNGGPERKKAGRARIVAVAAVPSVLVMSAALLAALGFGLDRYVLAGLVVGLGASVDSALLAAERLGNVDGLEDGRVAMRELAPSLASGTATTLVVLIPLAGLDFVSEGVARVAAAIAAVCVVTYLSTVFIMPPLVLNAPDRAERVRPIGASRPGVVRRRWKGLASRRVRRILAANARLCARRPFVILAAAFVLSAGGIIALALSPMNPQGSSEENSVYAHVEFEAGASATSVDERLADYTRILSALSGIEGVQSTARRGSGSVMARFAPEKTDRDTVAEACRRIGVPGGFAWVPEPSSGERSWELSVSGDDDAECRRVAERAAEAVSSLPFVLDTVLNFKDGPADVTLRPDRAKASALGAGFAQAADALRRGVHGPVAYKRLDDDGETDVRVSARRGISGVLPGIADAASLLVLTESGSVRVDSFMSVTREREPSRIYRRDRRRVASITMRSRPIDPRKAREEVETAIAGVERPAGYSLEFDRAAIEAADRLSGVGLSFVVAALLAYMATALVTESFGAPLVVLSSLPPSLAVPALLIAATNTQVNAAIACAFVAVSGIAVNASVLTVDERRADEGRAAASSASGPAGAMDLYRITRARLGSLAATSGTSVAGALPLLLLSGAGDSMARSLAFVTATGTAASFIVALTVVPALSRAAPRLFRSFALSSVGSSDCPKT